MKIGIIFCCLVQFFCSQTSAQANKEKSTVDSLLVAYSSEIMHEVDISDANVAINIWIKELGGRLKSSLVPKSYIFTNLEKLINSLNNNQVDLVAIPTLDYLEIKNKVNLIPVLIGTSDNRFDEKLVILVHKDSDIRSFKELYGKAILVTNSFTSNTLSYLWLETLFYENELVAFNKFIDQVKTVSKPSQAVLPVFFRQADVCVVSQRSFSIIQELNPQLKQDLKIIGISPGLLRFIFCIHADFDPTMRERIIKEACTLETNTKGRQLLTIFKIDDITKFKPEYLDDVIELVKKNKSLKSKSSR